MAFIGVKVYAVALYVEAEKMARELGVRNRCGCVCVGGWVSGSAWVDGVGNICG